LGVFGLQGEQFVNRVAPPRRPERQELPHIGPCSRVCPNYCRAEG
jgi:hypothetical protein